MDKTEQTLPAIQQIQFHEDTLWTVEQNGEVYVAVKPICERLNLKWPPQFRRLTRDPVLSQVITKLITTCAGDDGKSYQVESVCLPLDYLNGWLFKIDAARYKKDDPRRAAIIRYQQECYQVLFDYWHKGVVGNPRSRQPRRPAPGKPFTARQVKEARSAYFDLLKIAQSMGLTGNQAILSAVGGARKVSGVGLLELMDQRALLNEALEADPSSISTYGNGAGTAAKEIVAVTEETVFSALEALRGPFPSATIEMLAQFHFPKGNIVSPETKFVVMVPEASVVEVSDRSFRDAAERVCKRQFNKSRGAARAGCARSVG